MKQIRSDGMKEERNVLQKAFTTLDALQLMMSGVGETISTGKISLTSEPFQKVEPLLRFLSL